MAKAKKPTAKAPAKKKGGAKPGKALSPEELENVAGGLAPPPPGIVGDSAWKWAPAQKVIGDPGLRIIGPVDDISLNFKK